jgi:carboxymethylenebutenolidase
MRLHIVRPAGPGQFPGVLFFSEIYQVTEPIRRLAAMVAGQGYLVAMPEGTFPGGCIFSGRAAGRAAARSVG